MVAACSCVRHCCSRVRHSTCVQNVSAAHVRKQCTTFGHMVCTLFHGPVICTVAGLQSAVSGVHVEQWWTSSVKPQALT
jgi:hypothetical protein